MSVDHWWHRWIENDPKKEGGNNTATRANLRRAREPWEIVMVPAVSELIVGNADPYRQDDNIWICWLASALAWVETNDLRSMGEILVDSEVSESRFRRLLQSSTLKEFATQLIRILQQTGRVASIKDLEDAFVNWGSSGNRDRVRQKWAFSYYQHLPK